MIISDAGVQRERAFFSPYGRVFGMPAGDLNFDGEFTSAEATTISGWSAAYRAYADVNLDGVIDGDDATANTPGVLGWDALSRDGSTIGYAGYVQDSYIPTLSHVRHRVYKSDLGRWVQRDPAGYVDGANLYEYARSSPVTYVDWTGLASQVGLGFGRQSSGCGLGGVGVDSCGGPKYPGLTPVPCSPCGDISCCYSCCENQYGDDPELRDRCVVQCRERLNPPPPGCCKEACEGGYLARSYCCDGKKTTCICDENRLNFHDATPGMGQVNRCTHEYESCTQDMPGYGPCEPGNGEIPITGDLCTLVCAKARCAETLLSCLRGIECRGDHACQNLKDAQILWQVPQSDHWHNLCNECSGAHAHDY